MKNFMWYVSKKIGNLIILCSSALVLISCSQTKNDSLQTLVNLAHLNHLYEEIELNGQKMGIIHIYANYPEYDWFDAPGEGTACLDDVARAAIVYLYHYRYTNHSSSLEKANNLINYISAMQAPNGLFFNFLHSDYTINKDRSNSVPIANWWTWRAMWALAEFYAYFSECDKLYAEQLFLKIQRVFPAIDSLLKMYPLISDNHGLMQPDWLPYGTATDQAAIIVTALSRIYSISQDSVTENYLSKMCEGVSKMQLGDSVQFPYGAFLSWQNTWHAWGNSQSFGLFLAARCLNANNFKLGALNEVRYFFPYLMRNDYLTRMTVSVIDDSVIAASIEQFPQIAYDIRPMVWASLQAFEATSIPEYAQQAGEIACWLFGKNISNTMMYNPKNGRCFDGIENEHKINMNSGAESTIEALLILLEIERNEIARDIVHTYYEQQKGS